MKLERLGFKHFVWSHSVRSSDTLIVLEACYISVYVLILWIKNGKVSSKQCVLYFSNYKFQGYEFEGLFRWTDFFWGGGLHGGRKR